MGRMKELYIEICEANGGTFPGEMSLSQALHMRHLNLLNLEEYERHLTLQKLKNKSEESEKNDKSNSV